MKNVIKAGDLVNIFFTNTESEFNCKVIYVPSSPDDCFFLEREDGTPFNVKNFDKMVKIDKG